MAKGIREKIKLVSSAGTGHFYTTTKNKRTKPEKLELKKFDPVVRQHVIYKEAPAYTLKPGQPSPGQHSLLRPPFAVTPSTGILTCFPSTTPFGLALGVDSPCPD